MTREEHDKPRADAEERAALSACGALTPPERTALESDLARDGELRREVTRLDRVARALVATVDPVTPDPRVRDAVLRSAPGSQAKGAQVWNDWKDDEIDRAAKSKCGFSYLSAGAPFARQEKGRSSLQTRAFQVRTAGTDAYPIADS